MFYYKKLNENELSQYDYKKLKKSRFECLTEREKLKVKESFENDFSFWIIISRMQEALGFEMDRPVDIMQTKTFQRLKECLHKEFFHQSMQDDLIEKEAAHVFRAIEQSTKQLIQNEEKIEELSDVIDMVTKQTFDQNSHLLTKTAKKEEIVSYLNEIERDDLASFVEHFGKEQYRMTLNGFFKWDFNQERMYFDIIEDELEKTMELIKENVPLSQGEKRLLNEHLSAIEFHKREQKALKEDEEYDGYDDDEWWEIVGEPRRKALQYIEEMINNELHSIFDLWNNQKNEQLNELKQVFKSIILSNCYQDEETQLLFKQYAKEKLFKEETNLYVTRMQYEGFDEDDYYVYIEM